MQICWKSSDSSRCNQVRQ